MSDLIRREDVIEVLMETIAPTTLTLNTLVMRINSLPSAETHDKRTETHSVCSDLIRRSDAMGAVQDHFNADGFNGYDDGQKMLDRLKALPSAEAVQGWIPCSERLPDDNREVLISLEWGIDIGTYERGEWRSEWINHYDDDNVLAWMPLPTPYKGGDDE